MSIGILWVHTMCCDIANYFCQKCPILSFCERLVYFSLLQFCQKWSILSFCERTVDFFASSILSKLLNFVIFWETRVFFCFYNFVKNAQFCHFLREESVFFFHFFNFVINGPFCHIWKVDFKLWDEHRYTMSTHYVLWYSKLFLSKMPHFVILWEARVFFRFFNFVKNAQFCHFVRGPWIFSLLQFCQNCLILSFSERPVYFFASSILSKMLNFVILWEARGFFCFFNFVKNAQFCHFVRGLWIFFRFFNSVKMLNFVIFWEGRVFFSHFNIVKNGPFCHYWKVDFKLWDKHKYTMSAHYVLWYIKLFLSKMPHFVILWEARVFFRFFNFVKNAQFCHFVRGPWIFSLLQFCQNCLILSFSERPVYFFASSILSFYWERKVYFFHFFNFVINGPFCHFWKVDFKLWDKHKYTMSTHYVLWYSKLFLSKMPHFVIFWEARVFFASSILSKMINFVILWEDRGFFRFFNFVKIA